MGPTVTRDENTVDKRRINGTNLRRVWHQYEFNFETTEQSGRTEIHTQDAVRDDYCSDIATEIIREWTRDRGNIGWMYNEKFGERHRGTARVTRTGYVIRVEIFRQAFLTPRL